MIPTTNPTSYCSYLLRCWGEGGGAPAWRFSLEDTRSGERHGFADLEALMSFLRGRMQAACNGTAEPDVGVPP